MRQAGCGFPLLTRRVYMGKCVQWATMRSVAACVGGIMLLAGCAEGRWVHSSRTEAQAQQDWDICKAEVLAGHEHQKETMAGGINLSGCMQSKGYTYVEGGAPAPPTGDRIEPR
jgi:hypothetical protein